MAATLRGVIGASQHPGCSGLRKLGVQQGSWAGGPPPGNEGAREDLGRELLTQAPSLFTRPGGGMCVSSRPAVSAGTTPAHPTAAPSPSQRGQSGTGKGGGVSTGAGALGQPVALSPGPSSGCRTRAASRGLIAAQRARLLLHSQEPRSSHLARPCVAGTHCRVRRGRFLSAFPSVSPSASLYTPTPSPQLVTSITSHDGNTVPVCPPLLLPSSLLFNR